MAKKHAVRWRRRKEDRPAEIVTAALACFHERGFAATRLEDVAARAGVTKGTIYLYFNNKEELFKAVVRGEMIPNIERLEAAVREPASAAELLRRVITVWEQHFVPSSASVIPKLIIAESGNFPALARYYRETVVQRFFQLIAAIVRRGIADGSFRPVAVEHVIYSIIGPLLATVLIKHTLGHVGAHPLDAGAIGRAHLDLLLHGLEANKPQRPRKRRSAGAHSTRVP